MKFKTIMGAVFVLALILTACAPAETASPTAITEPTTVSTEPPMTESPAVTGSPDATESPAATDTEAAAETPTLSVPVTGATTVMVSESADFGPILVDGDGMSLYLFTNDTQNSGASTCTGPCAEAWPPLMCTDAGLGNENTNANTNSNTNDNSNTNTNANTNDNSNTNTNSNANTNDNTNTSGIPAAGDCSPEAIAGEGVDATLLGTITRDDGSVQITYNGWPLYYYVDDVAAGDTTGQGLEGVWFLVSPTGEAIQQ